MKLVVALGLVLATGLSQVALSEDQPATSPEARGVAEAIVNNCARVDPEHAADYQGLLQALNQGLSSEALAQIRDSDAYKQAYESTRESVAAVKADESLKTCRKSLSGGKK